MEQEQKTILIVDDEPQLLYVAGLILKTAGFNIIRASSGPEAIEKLKQSEGEVDLLVSDVLMGGMTGIELAQAVTAERPHIKVLLMSGFGEGQHVPGGWEFLPKPFDPSQLRDSVTRALGGL